MAQAKELTSAAKARAGQYTQSPMPFVLIWFGVPLVLIVVATVLMNHFGLN